MIDLKDYFDWIPEADEPKIEIPEMPVDKYSLILMNTPWDFIQGIQYDADFDETINGKMNRSYWYQDTFTNQAKKIHAIRDIKVKEITEDNSLLFIWTTGPRFLETVQLAVSWGFEFENVAFVWDTMIYNRSNHSKVNYTMTQTQFCLVCRKGQGLEPKTNDFKQLILTNETPLHNNHPSEVLYYLNKMFPKAKKIEMFGEQRFGGWDLWNIRYKP